MNENMNENPLSGYFRRPAIHMKLPTGGEFYPKDALTMPETNELPVYPMTSIDEITYHTPDALMNGSAIVDVVKSCIPSITNPWEMSADDLSAILIAIKIASTGHSMEIDSTCPECKTVDPYEIDLRVVSDNIKCPDYNKPLKIGDLEIMFKPLTYKDVTANGNLQLEEEMMNKIINDSDITEDVKIQKLSDSFKKISLYTIEALQKNIKCINTPNSSVSEPKFITDFLKNCEKTIYDKIKEEVKGLRDVADLKPISIKCDQCGYEYEQPFTLDMTSFFG